MNAIECDGCGRQITISQARRLDDMMLCQVCYDDETKQAKEGRKDGDDHADSEDGLQ